jgi:hypothetical protein
LVGGFGGAGIAAVEVGGWKWQGCGVVRLGRDRGCCEGHGKQTPDELGAAVGDEAELGGVVTVLGTKDAGGAQKIAVEAERSEEVAGVMGQAGGVGEGGGGGR